MSNVWEDTQRFTVSFRGYMVVGSGWLVWGLIWSAILKDESLWLQIPVVVVGVTVPIGFVALVKMLRPTPRWTARVENLGDNLFFALRSLRDQPVHYVELILTRPNGQRLLASDRTTKADKNMEFFHQYPFGFADAARWLVPGRYVYMWSIRPTKDTVHLLVVARGSCEVEPQEASDV